jgi:hypothetical protein
VRFFQEKIPGGKPSWRGMRQLWPLQSLQVNGRNEVYTSSPDLVGAFCLKNTGRENTVLH